MAKLVDELKELVSAFESNGIEYALCGGLAMAAHGFVRATMDIDILIPEESLEKAYQVGTEKGFDIRGLDISFKERAVEIRRISKVVGEDVISLDLLLVTPQVEEIWKTREKIDFRGQIIDCLTGRTDQHEEVGGQTTRPCRYREIGK